MSPGFSSLSEYSMPSTSTMGLELLIVPTPRMRIVAPSLPGFDEAWLM